MRASPETARRIKLAAAIGVAIALAGCASRRDGSPDDEPTIASLARRPISVGRDAGILATPAQTIAAYRRFLDTAPRARERPDAMRRIGDLEMDLADDRSAETGQPPDYRAAIVHYRELLQQHPDDPANDRVLYQLARAEEQAGALETSLATLDRLVARHPDTDYLDEAQFRRGELLFTMRDYAKAERAYATVLARSGASAKGTEGPYAERARYMQGWSMFKQGRLDESLRAFFGVLDHKLPQLGDEPDLADAKGLTRADRELVDDTFRVASIALASLKGAESIADYVDSDARRRYEFRVYQNLGELYLKQDRTKDAADTLALFAARQPLHAQAPLLQARVIDIYQANGFATLALDAKKQYVVRYGAAGDFRRANPEGWERAQPLVKAHLAELARHHHALARSGRQAADVDEAARWYRSYVQSFPADPQTPTNRFLLGELLTDAGRHAEAALEYEATAYDYPRHTRSADAGYAALLARAEVARRAAPAERAAEQRAGVESALRFAEANDADPRTTAVLTDAAEKLYALGDAGQAAALAQKVVQRGPDASQRRVAWTVLAHTAFDRGAYDEAERGYREVLAATDERAPGRDALVERLAASAYKQGEAARGAGRDRDAVAHFERVAALAPDSAVRATAQYDAASARIALKDWDGAAQQLEDFRRRFPNHALAADVGAKLAAVHLERGNWSAAANELERLAAAQADTQLARDALWQAAELHDKAAGDATHAGARAASARAYERYVRTHPQPAARAIEARWRLAEIAGADGQAARRLALLRELRDADLAAGAERSDRTRALGGLATLALAEPVFEAYQKVKLVEPLARSLKAKKQKMEEVLRAYAAASEYGAADVVTAATFRTAALYHDFGRALLDSQRPKRLKKAELEQYNVLLEEQAFPFEEKATELHEVNARRAAEGVWNEWVRRSYAALAALRPVRYGKVERDAPREAPPLAEMEAREAAARSAQALNEVGVAWRLHGRFDRARAAYERALAIEPAHAPTHLNLGILLDLYLRDAPAALAHYDRFLALTQGGDSAVAKWVVDLKNRKPPPALLSKKES